MELGLRAAGQDGGARTPTPIRQMRTLRPDKILAPGRGSAGLPGLGGAGPALPATPQRAGGACTFPGSSSTSIHFVLLLWVVFGFSFLFFLATNTCYFIIKTQNQEPVSSSLQPGVGGLGAGPAVETGRHFPPASQGEGPAPRPPGAACCPVPAAGASGADTTELPGCSHQEAQGRASCPAPTALN